MNQVDLLALDPSSTRTGYAGFTSTGELLDCGLLNPARASANAMDRVSSMAADLQELLIEWSPQKIVIEVPSGKVGAKHGGGGAGLTTYGFAVGAVWQACRNATVWANVHTVDESTWTRRVPKKKRQLLIAAQFPQYGAVVDIDKGGDVSDAIGIGLWWLTEEKLTWAVSTS